MLEVNLIPMLDVLMTVLTFFIIVSMTLTNQRSLDLILPKTDNADSQTWPNDSLVVELNRQGQILLARQPMDQDQLLRQVQTYLVQHPEGVIILKADYELAYQRVAHLLASLRSVGGDRVSLAIDSP
jgi:biopolymer transport protein ExbD